MAMMKQHQQKQVWEEGLHLAWIFLSLFFIEGSQGRNSNRAGTWRQEVKQRPVDNIWSSLLFNILFHRTQNHQVSDGTTHTDH